MNEQQKQQEFNIDTEYTFAINEELEKARFYLSRGQLDKFFVHLDVLCTYLAPKIDKEDSKRLNHRIKRANRHKRYWKARDSKVDTHESIAEAADGWKTLLFIKDPSKIMHESEVREGSHLFIVESRGLHREIIRLLGEYGVISTGKKSRY